MRSRAVRPRVGPASLALVLVLLASPLLGATLATKAHPTVAGIPWTGAPGVTRTVGELMAAERLATQAAEGAGPRPWVIKEEREFEGYEDRAPNPDAPHVSTWPAEAARAGAPPVPLAATQSVAASFTSATVNDSGFLPPDTMGAIGPTQFIAALNGRIRSFNRTTMTADGALDLSTDSFFSTVRSAGTSDPRIRFDRLTNRWFVVMIDVATPNRVLVAVSSGPLVTSTSSFTFFQFRQDLPTPAGSTADLADYPSVGIDANAIYIGVNQFGPSYTGTDVYVVRKSSVLSGGPIVVTAFRDVNSSADAFTPQGVDNFDDPSPTYGFFVADSYSSWGIVNVLRIANAGTTPTLTGFSVTVPDNNTPLKVEHLGNNHPGGTYNGKIDGNDNRPIQSTLKGASLWTSQGVACDVAGVSHGSTTPASDDRDGVRWYEIGSLGTTPTLVQSGTIFDSAASNPLFYTYGAVTPTGQGHAVMGMTAVGVTSYADAAFSARLSSDAAGTQTTPAKYTASTFAYNTSGEGTTRARRWGDYSTALLDPTDNMTVWASQEYAAGTGIWGVRVAKILAPPPATPATAVPASGAQGSSVTVTLTGTSSAGSGFYDPGPGFPSHVTASVSGTGVSVTNVSYSSPTSLTLTLAVANGAAVGARDVTVTNPDGQSATGVGIFGVTAGTCPGAAVSPSSLPNPALGSAYGQSLTVTGGSGTYGYAVTSGALPTGLSLSPAGALSGTPTVPGTFSFAVTATSTPAGCDAVQSYVLTVVGYDVAVASGTPQAALPNQAFGRPLVALVTDASSGNPASGVNVTFTLPASGASATFPGSVLTANAVTNGSGIATSPALTANGTLGAYSASATVSDGVTAGSFSLVNQDYQMVVNNTDAAAGSLRDIVANAIDGSTVRFDAGVTGTITLTTGEVVVGKNLTIEGPGARTLAVSGNNASRIFNILGGNAVAISGLTLTGGNTAAGGGAMTVGGGTLSLAQMTISGNTSNASIGGAIDNEGATITVTDSTISGNSSTYRGGAIQNQIGTITLTNSTLSGNSAGTAGRGGALRNAGGATASFVSCTIYGNSANQGGNLSALGGTVNLRNTIVAGGSGIGTSPTGPNLNTAGGSFVSQDYDLIETLDGVTVGGTTTHNLTGSPNVGTLANNGGPTNTHLPNVGSPVVAVIPSGSVTVSADQRGAARGSGAGGTSSMGSVEGTSATPVELKSFSAE